MRLLKRTGVWTARIIVVILILAAFAIGFGTPASDVVKMRLFSEAVDRWQVNPDFRKAGAEYCDLGSDAMRVKVCFVSGTKAIMFLRSLPGLPPHLAVNPTSQAHYDAFTQGPLGSYLRVSEEQGLPDTLKSLAYLATKQDLTDEDVRGFLGGFQLNTPIVRDAGAVASVRSLINDIDAGRTLAVTEKVPELLLKPIAEIASQLGYPTEVRAMTVAQQSEVWRRLDDYVKQSDYELWRGKQVVDFLNGIWAQGYGPDYKGAIAPMLATREVGRVAGPVMLMAWVGLAMWRRKRAADLAREPAADVGDARLALEGGDDIAEG
jgi:hypothetical protein